ncbi:MAG: hypothetical protein JWO98_4124 [Frankiales bacterium]|nr:hypothetical protein [Frankiales bacterium]
MQRSALPAPVDQRSETTDGPVATASATDLGAAADTVVVHVQLRPRRGATRKCLAALAALAAEHPEASFEVSGLSKDDRVVRITVGVDLGPRLGVARFSPQAQAAYAFVSAMFTSLYDHMPVYTAEPSGAERAAAALLLETVGGARAEIGPDIAPEIENGTDVPAPRSAGRGERVSA